MPDPITLKMIVLGAGGVGKSAITIQFVSDKFQERYDPTIEDSHRKTVTMANGQQYVCDIVDTAGQEELSVTQDQWHRQGNGFLFVYSITSMESFEAIKKIHKRVLAAKDKEKVACVLMGNKLDLESAREVSREKGEELAQQLGCLFFECSAKNRINVNEGFEGLITECNNNNTTTNNSLLHKSSSKEKIAAASKKCILL